MKCHTCAFNLSSYSLTHQPTGNFNSRVETGWNCCCLQWMSDGWWDDRLRSKKPARQQHSTAVGQNYSYYDRWRWGITVAYCSAHASLTLRVELNLNRFCISLSVTHLFDFVQPGASSVKSNRWRAYYKKFKRLHGWVWLTRLVILITICQSPVIYLFIAQVFFASFCGGPKVVGSMACASDCPCLNPALRWGTKPSWEFVVISLQSRFFHNIGSWVELAYKIKIEFNHSRS